MGNFPNFLIKESKDSYILARDNDIVYVSTDNSKAKLCLNNDLHYFSEFSFDEVLKKLPSSLFVQIQKGLAINVMYLKNFENSKANLITLRNDEELRIEEEYLENLSEQLTIL